MMPVTLRIAGVLLATSIALIPETVLAWGAEGHRISGLIAAELLTPRARIRLNDVMPGADLGDIANYLDINRPNLQDLYPGIDKWHYDNQPVCQTKTYDEYCPGGNCASARVGPLMKVAGDFSNPPEVRAMALRILVHIVGDIHQPLHAADDSDAGANFKVVTWPGAPGPRRLHAAWDTEFVRLMLHGGDERDFAHQLVLRYRGKETRDWQKGEIKDWMNDSYELSKNITYGKLPSFVCAQAWTATPVELPQSYVDSAVGVIPAQLAKAGARIAAVLNRVLDPSPFVESPPPAGAPRTTPAK
jgi:hypothetical protein